MVESSKAFSEGSVGIYIKDKFLKSVLPFRNIGKWTFEVELSRSSYRKQDEITGQLLREHLLPLTASSQSTKVSQNPICTNIWRRKDVGQARAIRKCTALMSGVSDVNWAICKNGVPFLLRPRWTSSKNTKTAKSFDQIRAVSTQEDLPTDGYWGKKRMLLWILSGFWKKRVLILTI